jgi:branched-chain amino acid transport system permease protein
MGLVAALLCWLKWTENGRAIRAVAQNREAAMLLGIDHKRMYALAFALNCFLAVAAGVMLSFLMNITPFMGFPVLVKAIAIVILGGLGSVVGTVIAAFLLAFSETLVSYYVPNGSSWTEGIAFMLIVAILLVRPRGILGLSAEF